MGGRALLLSHRRSEGQRRKAGLGIAAEAVGVGANLRVAGPLASVGEGIRLPPGNHRGEHPAGDDPLDVEAVDCMIPFRTGSKIAVHVFPRLLSTVPSRGLRN